MANNNLLSKLAELDEELQEEDKRKEKERKEEIRRQKEAEKEEKRLEELSKISREKYKYKANCAAIKDSLSKRTLTDSPLVEVRFGSNTIVCDEEVSEVAQILQLYNKRVALLHDDYKKMSKASLKTIDDLFEMAFPIMTDSITTIQKAYMDFAHKFAIYDELSDEDISYIFMELFESIPLGEYTVKYFETLSKAVKGLVGSKVNSTDEVEFRSVTFDISHLISGAFNNGTDSLYYMAKANLVNVLGEGALNVSQTLLDSVFQKIKENHWTKVIRKASEEYAKVISPFYQLSMELLSEMAFKSICVSMFQKGIISIDFDNNRADSFLEYFEADLINEQIEDVESRKKIAFDLLTYNPFFYEVYEIFKKYVPGYDRELFEYASKIGYSNIFWILYFDELEAWREEIDTQNNLPIVFSETLLTQYEGVKEKADFICEICDVPFYRDIAKKYSKRYKERIDLLKKGAKTSDDKSIKLAIENCNLTLEKVEFYRQLAVQLALIFVGGVHAKDTQIVMKFEREIVNSDMKEFLIKSNAWGEFVFCYSDTYILTDRAVYNIRRNERYDYFNFECFSKAGVLRGEHSLHLYFTSTIPPYKFVNDFRYAHDLEMAFLNVRPFPLKKENDFTFCTKCGTIVFQDIWSRKLKCPVCNNMNKSATLFGDSAITIAQFDAAVENGAKKEYERCVKTINEDLGKKKQFEEYSDILNKNAQKYCEMISNVSK